MLRRLRITTAES